MIEVRCKKGEPIERGLRRLRRKMEKECVMDEFKRLDHYVKPSLKRRIANGEVSQG